VSEVVPPGQLRAAIALNAAVFQATRLIGPAIAALLIADVGTGWVFAVNAACYAGPAIGRLRLRPSDLTPAPAAPREPGALRTTVRYLAKRPDVVWTIFLVGMFGTFGLNFPIVLTAMAKSTFGGNASMYGLFNIALAIGSATGALFAGAAVRPGRRAIVASAAAFGLLQTAAALAPDLAVFLALLAAMGLTNLAFQAMANASVQVTVDSRLRGRVMGLYMLAFIGGTPVGAPLIGALTSHFGARAGMIVCGAVPVLAAVVMAAARRPPNQPTARGNPRTGHGWYRWRMTPARQPLLRTYRPSDHDALVSLWSRCGLLRPWNDPCRDIRRKLAQDPGGLLVLDADGRLAGAVMTGYDGHRGWVNYLAVDPAYQGHGLGRLLMREAERRLLAAGCPKVNLQVRTSNERAVAFYRHLGYDTDDVVSMGKRLIDDTNPEQSPDPAPAPRADRRSS
jgi:GNAT superfamily N-acetyltransferase